MKTGIAQEMAKRGLDQKDFALLTAAQRKDIASSAKATIPVKQPAKAKPQRIAPKRIPRIDIDANEMDKELKKKFKDAAGKHFDWNEHMAEYYKANVTKKEHGILYGKKTGYIRSHNYQNINTAMREHTPLKGRSKTTKETLEDIITRNKLEQDTIFYRSEGGDAFLESVLEISREQFETWDTTEFNKQLSGKAIPDDAFKSVSSNIKANYFINKRDIHCIIKAKEGTPIFFTDNADESEAIFAGGVKAKIGRIWCYNTWSVKPELRKHGHGCSIIMEVIVG